MKILKDKKGYSVYKDWAEIVSIFLLIIGFLISITAKTLFLAYLILIICGFLVGRVFYFRGKNVKFPFFLIVAFFIIGYFIGMKTMDRGGFFICFTLFFIGAYAGYILHKRRYLT
ncbi:MAG: hypothetical protein ACOCZQ_02095 [Nanoarchaeota archaeon]